MDSGVSSQVTDFHQWMCWKDLKDPYLTRIVCRLYSNEYEMNDEQARHPLELVTLVQEKDIEALRIMLGEGYIVDPQFHVIPVENYRPGLYRFEFSIGVSLPIRHERYG